MGPWIDILPDRKAIFQSIKGLTFNSLQGEMETKFRETTSLHFQAEGWWEDRKISATVGIWFDLTLKTQVD